ncbi:MAG: hypothetical protein KDK96_09620 [Chlamydiia bacterium]|nr:hypothetical protein [Chlamydiia bacterium]
MFEARYSDMFNCLSGVGHLEIAITALFALLVLCVTIGAIHKKEDNNSSDE